MKKIFRNANQVACVFTDEGVAFSGSDQQVYFPYGSLESIRLSLLGLLQATRGTRICSFSVDRQDRAEVKKLVAQARAAMKTAPKAQEQVIDLTRLSEEQLPPDASPEKQREVFKALFVQGAISRDEYLARKRLLED